MSAFKRARNCVRVGIICEFSRVDTVPGSTLLQSYSLIRPFSSVVLGEIREPNGSRLRHLKNTGLQGIVLTCPDFFSDLEFAKWARPVIAAARAVLPSVMLCGLSSPARARIAADLGATHGGIRNTRIIQQPS